MANFAWNPDTGATEDREPKARSARFGDGYEQRAPDGLNADMRKRVLNFSGRPASDVTAIVTFLEARAGVESFTYTHPGDSSRTYVCRSWKITDGSNGTKTINATFEQVPA